MPANHYQYVASDGTILDDIRAEGVIVTFDDYLFTGDVVVHSLGGPAPDPDVHTLPRLSPVWDTGRIVRLLDAHASTFHGWGTDHDTHVRHWRPAGPMDRATTAACGAAWLPCFVDVSGSVDKAEASVAVTVCLDCADAARAIQGGKT